MSGPLCELMRRYAYSLATFASLWLISLVIRRLPCQVKRVSWPSSLLIPALAIRAAWWFCQREDESRWRVGVVTPECPVEVQVVEQGHHRGYVVDKPVASL
jgi:hypothetical protein